KNVAEYYRVYKDLGYRGPAGEALEAEAKRRKALAAPVTLTGSQGRSAASRSAESATASAEEGQGDSAQTVMTEGGQHIVPRSVTPAVGQPGRGRRAVVVAMKPQ